MARKNWAAQQRLRFIDAKLAEQGTFNRASLMEKFGISTPQASYDILSYRKVAPDNAKYDPSAKTYRRTDAFERVWPPEPLAPHIREFIEAVAVRRAVRLYAEDLSDRARALLDATDGVGGQKR